MKDSARQILDGILDIFESGNITPLTLDKPVCNPSYFEEVARCWGITIKKVPKNKDYVGIYRPRGNKIYLTTNDPMVYYHELAHCGLNQFIYSLWEKPNAEIIA